MQTRNGQDVVSKFSPRQKKFEMAKKTDVSDVQRAVRLFKLKTEFATWSKKQQKAEIESFKTRIIHER